MQMLENLRNMKNRRRSMRLVNFSTCVYVHVVYCCDYCRLKKKSQAKLKQDLKWKNFQLVVCTQVHITQYYMHVHTYVYYVCNYECTIQLYCFMCTYISSTLLQGLYGGKLWPNLADDLEFIKFSAIQIFTLFSVVERGDIKLKHVSVPQMNDYLN